MSSPGFGYAKDRFTKFDCHRFTQKGIERLCYARDKAVQFDYSRLFAEAGDGIKAHPYRTAFHIINGVAFIAPGLITGPILWGMGFSSLGPVAGSKAAIYQAAIGNVPAGSLFAYLESAGAAGYGVVRVNAFARVGAILTEATAAFLNTRQEGETRTKGEEKGLGERKAQGGLVNQARMLWSGNMLQTT